MRFHDEGDAITFIFRSLRRLRDVQRGPDDQTRDPSPTRVLLACCGLPNLNVTREYAVVTGSKGKGSTTAILAKLLQHIGHTTGMLTSPHLVDFRERIRVNGRMIPEGDFIRIVDEIAPEIDRIEATFTGMQYLSPQGIFLAIALRWFEEQGATAAVLEVGRGGRYDDVAVAPNRLSLFTPILLEHTAQLGGTLERIAWHKAGIIKPHSTAYSVPQATAVLEVLQTEADAQDAEFSWIAPMDMGQLVRHDEAGIHFTLTRYGELYLPLHGRYEIENATLAVQGAGNMHGRLTGIPHGSAAYTDAIRSGLAAVQWPGRMQKLQDAPAVWVDGATTVIAAESMLKSLGEKLRPPVIAIIGTPSDRDTEGVYRTLAPAVEGIILTHSDINANVRFPAPDVALASAGRFHDDVRYAPNLGTALDWARTRAGRDGTVIAAVAQPLVGESMLLYGLRFEVI